MPDGTPTAFEGALSTHQDRLWHTQLLLYPDSVRIPYHAVLQDWCQILGDPDPAMMRQVVLAKQHEGGVFYECCRQGDGSYKYRGYRYGLHPGQYMGGFGTENN
jgi:hypothetical protein